MSDSDPINCRLTLDAEAFLTALLQLTDKAADGSINVAHSLPELARVDLDSTTTGGTCDLRITRLIELLGSV